MTVKEFNKLKIGDKVEWPEGANQCSYCAGSVFKNEYGNRGILWDDGQETYPTDDDAMQYVRKPA